MHIQVLSDLHFEFHEDGGRSFVASLDPRDVDVLVLAGDIAVGKHIGAALDLFALRFPQSLILYVHGNHEYYHHSLEEVHQATRLAAEKHSHVHWLHMSILEVSGVRFLGTPLWFREDPQLFPLRRALNDFNLIQGFTDWIYQENGRALDFLERELRPSDVVITHHLPAVASVHEAFRDHPLTGFFLCDVEPLIQDRQPKLWIHGHTHSSVDAQVGATRVVCNPLGYPREQNAEFRSKLLVEA